MSPGFSTADRPQPAAAPLPATVDQNYGVLTGTQSVPSFPSQVEVLVYAEGTFVYLDGGSLDVGIVRDSSLVQTNRYIQFQETFEGVYRKGPEAIRMVAELVPTGGSVATVAPGSFAV